MASKLTDREFAIMLNLCLNHDSFRPEGLDEQLDPNAAYSTEKTDDTKTAEEMETPRETPDGESAAAASSSTTAEPGESRAERGLANVTCEDATRESSSQRGGWLSLPLLVACLAAICLIPACWLWLRDGVSAIEESAVDRSDLFQHSERHGPPGQHPASDSLSDTSLHEPAARADLLAGRQVTTHPLLAPRNRLAGEIIQPGGATPIVRQLSP